MQSSCVTGGPPCPPVKGIHCPQRHRFSWNWKVKKKIFYNNFDHWVKSGFASSLEMFASTHVYSALRKPIEPDFIGLKMEGVIICFTKSSSLFRIHRRFVFGRWCHSNSVNWPVSTAAHQFHRARLPTSPKVTREWLSRSGDVFEWRPSAGCGPRCGFVSLLGSAHGKDGFALPRHSAPASWAAKAPGLILAHGRKSMLRG